MADRTAPGPVVRGFARRLSTLPDGAAALAALRAWLVAERERWVLWSPVLLGLGIVVYFALPAEPPLWPVLLALGATLGVAVALRRRHVVLLAMLALALVLLGFGAAVLRTQLVAAPILSERLGPAAVTGTVHEIALDPRRARLVLDDLAIDRVAPERTPERVRLTLRGRQLDGLAAAVAPGDRVRLRAVLRPPPGPTEPDAYDFARDAYFDRIGGLGYALGRPERLDDGGEGSLATWLRRMRQAVSQRFIAGLPGEAGPLGAALVIGERTALPEELNDAMRDSGLAHLIAISGMNFVLVAGLVFFVLRAGFAAVPALALRHPIKKWAAAGALIAAFGYLLLTGAPVPTQRAFLMTALVLIAILLDRTSLSMRLLMWAALALLLLMPEDLFGPSFQMSFAATLALIAAYEAIRGPLGRLAVRRALWQRPFLYLAAVVFTSLIAGFATGPFSLYHFNRFADYGLVANLIAVPLTGLWVMPWGVFALVLMPFGVEGAALTPMAFGLEAIAAAARMVAGWPGAVSLVPSMPAPTLALIVLGGLWLCLWRRRPRLLGVVPIAVAALIAVLARPPDVLVEGEAKLFAVRGADGRLWLSSQRQARFVGDAWLRRSGQDEAGPWPERWEAGEDQAGEPEPRRDALPPACDTEGCAFTVRGLRLAIVTQRGALAEECAGADVLIALIPLRGRAACERPTVVLDRYDLWRAGTHALWLDDDEVRVRSTRAARGVRPWAPPRSSRREAREAGRRAAEAPAQ
jgi:competence protein ComEC